MSDTTPCLRLTGMTPHSAHPPVAPTHLAARRLHALSRALGHGWACDPRGPTPEQLARDSAAAIAAWHARLAVADAALLATQIATARAEGNTAAVAWLEAHPTTDLSEWPGLDPQWIHRSGSNTVRWHVQFDGRVTLSIHLPPTFACDLADRIAVAAAVAAAPVQMRVSLPVSGPPDVWLAPGFNPAENPEAHIEGCACVALAALGLSAWAQPPVRPLPRPLLSPGRVRQL